MAEQSRRKAPGKRPIIRHPLFPVTVALWCGAIFALASLALAPPIGMAVRVVLVLAMAVVGGLLGLVIARRLAGSKQAAAAPEDRSGADGNGGNALWSELRSEHRALVPSEDRPALEHAEAAPPTEREPRILDVASVGIDGFDSGPVSAAEAGESDGALRASADTAESAPQDEPPVPSAAERIAGADLDELSHVELLERLAMSMQRRNSLIAAADTGSSAGVPEEDHGPLLELERPARTEQTDEPPVAFPGQAERRSGHRGAASVTRALEAPEIAERQDPETAENALRDALAALQRMSGSR